MTYGMRRVKPRSVGRKSRLRVYVAVLGITVLMTLYLSMHVVILSLQNAILAQREDHAKVRNEIKNLEIELTGLRKGSRIIAIARDRLGLAVPEGAPERLF